jgi:ribonuclease HII
VLKQYYSLDTIEVGCDEAGRGCLAGPVVAAAVVLPKNYENTLLNDSKKLTAKQRQLLETEIKKVAIEYAIGVCTHEEIDKINILNASILAMHKALMQLHTPFNLILVDGNRFKNYKKIAHKTVIKGDSIYMSIAAASVLAKTYRDNFMSNLALDYPKYAWQKNAGYPTQQHRNAIQEIGLSPYHRKTFRQLKDEASLF